MQGHVFMIVNDHPELRRIFCGKGKGFKCKKIMVATNVGNGNTMKPNLIIEKPARRGKSTLKPGEARVAELELVKARIL